jgi:prepilin-type N-terminal cleavage/methylation domain-containing protein
MKIARQRQLRARARRAFTLLEVLIAMAIVALVLVAMNTFVFSMGELWGRNSDLRLFELHVRNVTRFLQRELQTASLPPFAAVNETGISVQETKSPSGFTDNLLTFELPEGSRLFAWPERPLPDVVCALSVRDREGLFILWRSRLEKKFEDDPPRESIITPWVTEMSYEYYDPDFKSWKNERSLRREGSGEYVVPQRLRLKFSYNGRTLESVIGLPAAGQGLPML